MVFSSELNAAVVDCVVVSVHVYVFVRGTVLLNSGLNYSVGNCVVPVYVFVRGTVMLSSGLIASVVDYFVVSVDVFAGVGVTVHLSPSFC